MGVPAYRDEELRKKVLRNSYKLANRWNLVDSIFTILGALSLSLSFILSLLASLCAE